MKSKDAIVTDLKKLFQPVFQTDFEKNICDRLDITQIITIARRFNTDRVGVEIVAHALKLVSDNLQVHNTTSSTKAMRLNVTQLSIGEHQMASSYDFFKNGFAEKVYPFGASKDSTGFRHQQAPDGVWALDIVLHGQHTIFGWLLNYESDGDDKKEARKAITFANKMWQAVDFQRAYNAQGCAFTLRSNLFSFKSSKIRVKSEEISTDKLRRELLKAYDGNETKTKIEKTVTEQEHEQYTFQEYSNVLMSFTKAHVHFICEMLRYVCCDGNLYNYIFANDIFKKDEVFFDVHGFIGDFNFKQIPETLVLHGSLLGGDIKKTTPGGANAYEFDRQEKNFNYPFCTYPSVFGQISSRHSPWNTWSASVVRYFSASNLAAQTTAVNFLCVQRVNMQVAMKAWKEQQAEQSRMAANAGVLAPQANLTPKKPHVWNGIWSVRDIIFFLDNVVLLSKNSNAINESIQNELLKYGLTMFCDGAYDGVDATLADLLGLKAGPNYHNLFRFRYMIKDDTWNRASKPLRILMEAGERFQPPPNNKSFFTHGYTWVVMSFAAEMINALLSLWLQDIDKNRLETKCQFEEAIVWRTSTNNVSGATLFRYLKSIHDDMMQQHLNRDNEACKPNEDFEQIDLGDNYLVYLPFKKSSNASLQYECFKSMLKDTPKLNKELQQYLKRFNCPGLEVFLQILRCNNQLALKSLLGRTQSSETLKNKFNSILQEFPVVTQSEILYAIEYSEQDPFLLQITFKTRDDHFKQIRFGHMMSKPAERMNDLHGMYNTAEYATASQEDRQFLKLKDSVIGYSAAWTRIMPLYKIFPKLARVTVNNVYLPYDPEPELEGQHIQSYNNFETATWSFRSGGLFGGTIYNQGEFMTEATASNLWGTWMLNCWDDNASTNNGVLKFDFFCRAMYMARKFNQDATLNFLEMSLRYRTDMITSAMIYNDSHLLKIRNALPANQAQQPNFQMFRGEANEQLHYNFASRNLEIYQHFRPNGNSILAYCTGAMSVDSHYTRSRSSGGNARESFLRQHMSETVVYVLSFDHEQQQQDVFVNVHSSSGLILHTINLQTLAQLDESIRQFKGQEIFVAASKFQKNVFYLASNLHPTIYKVDWSDLDAISYSEYKTFSNNEVIMAIACSQSSSWVVVLVADATDKLFLKDKFEFSMEIIPPDYPAHPRYVEENVHLSDNFHNVQMPWRDGCKSVTLKIHDQDKIIGVNFNAFGAISFHVKSWVLLYGRQFHRISEKKAEMKYQYIETIEQDEKYYLDGDVTRKHVLKSRKTGKNRADGEDILEWIGATELHWQILYVYERKLNDNAIELALLNGNTASTKMEVKNLLIPLNKHPNNEIDGSLMLVFHDKNLWINDPAVTTQTPPLGFSWKCYKLMKNENKKEHKFYANNMQTLHKSIVEGPTAMRRRDQRHLSDATISDETKDVCYCHAQTANNQTRVVVNQRFHNIEMFGNTYPSEDNLETARQISYIYQSCKNIRAQNGYTTVQLQNNDVARVLYVADEYTDNESGSDDEEFEFELPFKELQVSHDAWTLQNCLSGKLETELLFFSNSLLKHDVSPQEIHHFYEDLSNMILREWITLSQPQPFTLTHSSSLDSNAERFELVCTMYEQPRVLFLERAIRQHYDIKSMTWLTNGWPHDDALDENSTNLSDSPYNAKLDLAVLAPTIFDFFASDLWYSRELVATVFEFWKSTDNRPTRFQLERRDVSAHNMFLQEKFANLFSDMPADDAKWRRVEIWRNFLATRSYADTFKELSQYLKHEPKNPRLIREISAGKKSVGTKPPLTNHPLNEKTGLKFLQQRLIRRLWLPLQMRYTINKNAEESTAVPEVKKYVEVFHDMLVKRLAVAYRWKRFMITSLLFNRLMLLQFWVTEYPENNPARTLHWKEADYNLTMLLPELSTNFTDFQNRWLAFARQKLALKIPQNQMPSDGLIAKWSCSRDGLIQMADVTTADVNEVFEAAMIQALSTSSHKTHSRTLEWLCTGTSNETFDQSANNSHAALIAYLSAMFNEHETKTLPAEFRTHFITPELRIESLKSLFR